MTSGTSQPFRTILEYFNIHIQWYLPTFCFPVWRFLVAMEVCLGGWSEERIFLMVNFGWSKSGLCQFKFIDVFFFSWCLSFMLVNPDIKYSLFYNNWQNSLTYKHLCFVAYTSDTVRGEGGRSGVHAEDNQSPSKWF